MTEAAPGGALGLGVNAGFPGRVARDLATRCADLGYRSLWSNDEPSASGLETLARFAEGAPHLDLGVGVLPLDRFPPDRIVAEVERLGLDPSKLWLGVGSGRLRPSLAPVADGVAQLRQLLPPSTRVFVAAMRPQLARLGGAIADGVLLNWMRPVDAERARQWVHEGAEAAGHRPPTTATYVRVAVGPGAQRRLDAEEGRYRTFDPAHFAAMDVPLGSVGIAADNRADVQVGLARYRAALDLTIVRVLAGSDLASLVAVAEAAAP